MTAIRLWACAAPLWLLLAASAAHADTICYGPNRVLAFAGQICNVNGGTYAPGAGTGYAINAGGGALGATDTGFGFVATGEQRPGASVPSPTPGIVNSTGAVTIETSSNSVAGIYAGLRGTVNAGLTASDSVTIQVNARNSINGVGVLAESGGAVNLGGTTSITIAAPVGPTNTNSVGLWAQTVGATAGTITVNGPLTLNALADNASGVLASGAGSKVTLNGASTLATTGLNGFGLEARSGLIDVNGALFVTTSGANSYGLRADSTLITFNGVQTFGAGGTIAASGNTVVTVAGANSVGGFASGAGSTLSLNTATFNLNGANGTGLQILSGAIATVSGAASFNLNGANGAGVQVSGGAATFSGALNIQGTGANAIGVALAGAGAQFSAIGGGSIATTGPALSIVNATNFTATFDGVQLTSSAGNLIFADPSNGTLNFASATLNAGTNALLDATNGGVIAVNANASTLTGSILADAASTVNLTLANGSTWNVTANSSLGALVNNGSSILFAPPDAGGYKTVSVTSYSGANGALITMNAALGGNGSPADRLVINGGAATGTTLVTLRNIGGIGAQTTGFGIPLIVAQNGATTTANAFQLSSAVVVNGYGYQLVREANQSFYLQSTAQTAAPQVSASLAGLGDAHVSQLIANRVLGSILLGANEQISCGNCGSGFAAIGSFAIGAHGRWALTDSLTVLGGLSYDLSQEAGASSSGPILAAALRYDPAGLGAVRPFAEIGAIAAPLNQTRYVRSYTVNGAIATGSGVTQEQEGSAFGRLGVVARVTPRDELAVYGDLIRGWQHDNAYSEAAGGTLYPATFAATRDALTAVKAAAQYTHLLTSQIELNGNIGLAHGFGGMALTGVTDTLGPLAGVSGGPVNWVEFGGRIGYRYSREITLDAFVLGVAGPAPAGHELHGGLAMRFTF
jgi:hypothetical protein